MGTTRPPNDSTRLAASGGDLRSCLSLPLAQAIHEEDPRGLIEAANGGTISAHNDRAIEILGAAATGLGGLNVFQLLRERITDGSDLVKRFRKEGIARGLHTFVTRFDGSTKRVELTLKRVTASSLVLIITDEDVLRSDALTGIGSRHEFFARLNDEVERLKRVKRVKRGQIKHLSMLVIDVDHFKRVNDKYGHPAGDQVLREIAAATAAVVRKLDTVARVGGEEIAVLLPDTDGEGAAILAERIRERIQALTVMHDGQSIRATASIGVATVSSADAEVKRDDVRVTLPTLIYARADAALYQAKHGGRNRVCVHAA